jgi:hypothetical protein
MERHRRHPIPEPLLVDLVKERGEQLIALLRASLAIPRDLRHRATGGIKEGALTLENRVDEVVTTGLHNLNIATQDDIMELHRQLDDLSARLERFIASQEGDPHPPQRRSSR